MILQLSLLQSQLKKFSQNILLLFKIKKKTNKYLSNRFIYQIISKKGYKIQGHYN